MSIAETEFPLKREICVSTYFQRSKMAAASYNNPFVYPVVYLFTQQHRHQRVESG